MVDKTPYGSHGFLLQSLHTQLRSIRHHRCISVRRRHCGNYLRSGSRSFSTLVAEMNSECKRNAPVGYLGFQGRTSSHTTPCTDLRLDRTQDMRTRIFRWM
ncbi:hypothetical protein IGI04_016532 [Brassica rapa subsp. trilocularis]|uniref:Uncharacterized protein n=1 Tax=Brassica rapa subsp. trilocularis TaxID=1813537 RepID=A0ABQ7MT82_BRACM|nr:hypothetical protein IGI04_016532 [Brassica rapa subsp. trilocularis]